MTRVMIRQTEGYWLFPDALFQEWHNDPIGEVDALTLERWQALQTQWEGLQTELKMRYSDWTAREFWEPEA